MGSDYKERIQDLTKVVSKCQRSLANFAWTCLSVRGYRPNVQDIEDVVSDAYLVAATLLRADPLVRIRNFEAWFRKILFFRCLRHAKKYGIEKWNMTIQEIEHEDEVLEVLHKTSDLSSSLLVDELLEELKESDQQILKMAAEGFTSEEIGKKLGISPESIRQRKSRAMKTLRKII